MTLKNKLGEWMHGNKTRTIPQKDGEGYIEELENNSSVLGLMDGKSIHFFLLHNSIGSNLILFRWYTHQYIFFL